MRIAFHFGGDAVASSYHKHPHVIAEHDHPNRIEDQTRRAMETIKTILEHQGLTWTDVVKVTKYLTDIRDQDGMVAVMKGIFRRVDAGEHNDPASISSRRRAPASSLI